jgi:ABC-2 type transport system ATP-binding protein
MSDFAIEAVGLCKSYGSPWRRRKVQVLDGVSLTVPRGSCFGLVGPPGSGKTTLIRIFLLLLRPDAGTVTILGERAPGAGVLSRVGSLPEHSRKRKQVLRRFARSGTDRPDLLLLDGAMEGMDAAGQLEVLHLLQSLRSDGVTIFLSSHDLSWLEPLCSDVANLSEGRIAATGKMSELRTAQGCVVHVDALPECLQDDLAAAGYTVGINEQDCWVASHDRLQLNILIDRLQAAAVSIQRVETLLPSMERIYRTAMGRSRYPREMRHG